MKKDKNFKGDHLFTLAEKLHYYSCRCAESSSVTPGQREYAQKRQDEIFTYMNKNDLEVDVKNSKKLGRLVISQKPPKHLK